VLVAPRNRETTRQAEDRKEKRRAEKDEESLTTGVSRAEIKR